jgi:hypothetical protein
MNIGDLVWNSYHGIMRFGTVISKRIKTNKWAYFTVKWHDDEAYEKSMAWRQKLGGGDHTLKEYRADLLKKISIDRFKKIVEGHEESLKENF